MTFKLPLVTETVSAVDDSHAMDALEEKAVLVTSSVPPAGCGMKAPVRDFPRAYLQPEYSAEPSRECPAD